MSVSLKQRLRSLIVKIMEQYTPNWKKQQRFLKFTLIAASLVIAGIVFMRWSAPAPAQQALLTPPPVPSMVPPQAPPAPNLANPDEKDPQNSADVAATTPLPRSPATPEESPSTESEEEFQATQEANTESRN